VAKRITASWEANGSALRGWRPETVVPTRQGRARPVAGTRDVGPLWRGGVRQLLHAGIDPQPHPPPPQSRQRGHCGRSVCRGARGPAHAPWWAAARRTGRGPQPYPLPARSPSPNPRPPGARLPTHTTPANGRELAPLARITAPTAAVIRNRMVRWKRADGYDGGCLPGAGPGTAEGVIVPAANGESSGGPERMLGAVPGVRAVGLGPAPDRGFALAW